jgi:NAD(P)-dependent dehydrogenase (short-subunit alcohol dehydrogenase family)
MDLGLKGKVAIVTGGSRGIGRIIVRTLVQEGTKVVIASTNTDRSNSVVKEVEALGGEALMIKTDVSKLEETERLCSNTFEKFRRVDIIIHNAACFFYKPFLETPVETWENLIDVILIGALNCCRSVLKHMTEQSSGRIIFIGSDAERTGDRYQSIYTSAKGAVIAFAKSLAQDVGPKGITVNVVSPALVLTKENRELYTQLYGLDDEKRANKLLSTYPMRKLGTPEDVANLVAFLSSDRASFITGQTICVNGGYCML